MALLLGLLIVVASPSVNSAYWTPRVAVVLVLLALGIRPFGQLLARRDATAFAVAGFVLIASLSALLSAAPGLAALGQYNAGTGAIYAAALAATWALGRVIDRGHVDRAGITVVIGASANSVVGLVQVGFDLPFFPFDRHADGRAAGLLGNPVHLGTLTAAALLFCLSSPRLGSRLRLGMACLAAAGLQASGSRGGLALMVLVPLAALIRERTWRRVLIDVCVVAIGFGLTLAVADPSTASSTARLSEAGAGGGVTSRVEVWSAGLAAMGEHPILGHGPNQFRAAHLPHRTLEAARVEGPDRLFGDAHNIFVEYLVTTGIAGLVALVAWLLLSVRRARREWLFLAVALLAGHLLQPQMLTTTTLLFFSLGAAQPRLGWCWQPAGRDVLPTTVALVCGATLLVGDFWLNQARLDLDPDDAQTAERLLPVWPTGASAVAQSFAFASRVDREGGFADDAIAWRKRAIRRDPSSPYGWTALGDEYFGNQQYAEAADAYERVLVLDPYSVNALNGLAYVAIERRDAAAAKEWFRRSLGISAEQPAIRNLDRRLPDS